MLTMRRTDGREITYQSISIEKWAAATHRRGVTLFRSRPITGRPGSEFLVQHLREVAIDHTNGVFAGTNDFVEKIGDGPRSPLKLS
jgi:NAD(P)H dehydrogenase (quinone)